MLDHSTPIPDSSTRTITVQGAREHNLQNVDLTIPRDALVVFSGLSGSGKSSLAFDTIYAEGQRRYVESLSAYARQFLGQMDKPDVDFIEGLSPAISIDQKTTSKNPRSTVGTITEVYDYLRLLYARIGKPHCPECNRPITQQSAQEIADQLLAFPEGTRYLIMAPVVRGKKGNHQTLMADLSSKGYARARVDGEIISLAEPPELARYEQHTIEVVLDRLVAKAGIDRRVTDSVEQALALGDGLIAVQTVPRDDDTPESFLFSEHLACPYDGLSFDKLAPRSFSFNTPYGACADCDGLGIRKEVDPELLIAGEDTPLNEGAIIPFDTGMTKRYFSQVMAALAKELGFDPATPWSELDPDVQQILLYGYEPTLTVAMKNRFGRRRTYSANFEGAIPWVTRQYQETDVDSRRERFEAYFRDVPCTSCHGARLAPLPLHVRINDHSIADVADMPINESVAFFQQLVLSDRERQIAEPILKEINDRLAFLADVGLTYLTLSRSAGTLAGGEAQRIRLATQIGSGLVGCLYVLDEPSIGLHQRDNERLIGTLLRLRDLGNTVLVVEHDRATLEHADHIVEIGPGAGEHGGTIVHNGSFAELMENPASITAKHLREELSVVVPEQRRQVKKKHAIRVVGAAEHNLQSVDVDFPLGVFCAVTGVSGSGKSTLVNDILKAVLLRELNGTRIVPGKFKRVTGLDLVDKVVGIDQSPIGRTPRSNPVTYTGAFDHIRKLFAATTEAKVRGYQPGRFSFNVKGGRCEHCRGDGTITIDMQFLPDIAVVCEVCDGARYNRETLSVHYKGKTIADVLQMPIEEANAFFANQTTIANHLQTLVDVGLGYVRLGQSATTLSGGEAQRVKLASELRKRATGQTVYILDEPTTGLHMEDVRRLLEVLHRLVDKGNTVIVIEHDLDVIKTADWIIDMGPEGGSGGGTVVATGTPETIARTEGSHTGRFLRPLLPALSNEG
ncbi:excinuclease ABC subunit UvrA [Stomatohabitans albus]|uniref:excinuclease ABC subunit UvrA n=1 Tax=Stomatohabitans albus TaxID=3110766 RepID=UPI00300BFDC5